MIPANAVVKHFLKVFAKSPACLDKSSARILVRQPDNSLDKRASALTALIEAHHKAAIKHADDIDEVSSGRLTTLETDKAAIQGGWKAMTLIGGAGTAIGAAGAWALKLVGVIK